MKRAIFIDLDGTLLPMDENIFLKEYMGRLGAFMSKNGFDGNKIIEHLWIGTKAMYLNDGSKTNEEAFFQSFEKIHGSRHPEEEFFMQFYKEEFPLLKSAVTNNELAKNFISWCKKNFQYVVLSTNPLFPQIATYTRIKWLGIDPNSFDLVTTYENSSFCKPNPLYFIDLLKKFNLKSEEVIMIGNNDLEDYDCSSKAGIECVIVDDTRIKCEKIDVKNHCSFSSLIDYLSKNFLK